MLRRQRSSATTLQNTHHFKRWKAELKEVCDFRYLGSWVNSSEQDIKIRKALAWKSLNDMKKIWRSNMSRKVKISFYLATVESVLLYGCVAWTLTPALERALNGCYMRMLRAALNISWQDQVTNSILYCELPQVGNKLVAWRMQLAGHCQRHPELPTHRTILWEPNHRYRRQERPRQTYVDILKRDSCVVATSELASLMKDQKTWGRHVRARLRPPK